MTRGSNNASGSFRRLMASRASAPLLALLLVLTLLACHGVLGGTHQATLELVPSMEVHPYPLEEGPANGHSMEHATSHVYYVAAFFVVLFGSLLGLLLRVTRRRYAAALQMARPAFVASYLSCGRALTIPQLQVLRL